MNRKPYSGPSRKLVLAFDVGTTFSGISYCLLEPGETPAIRGVTRFPAQERVGGDCKIPTIILYDSVGNVGAVGAEATVDITQMKAEEEGWTKAEWFKLHLRPKTTSSASVTNKIPPLPEGKTAIQVFADFLRYLHSCAQTYIEETHADGIDLWKKLTADTEFVLTHPNGWEGGQQIMMREAAAIAGLIPDTKEGQSRLFFVTEGEASLHFCVQNGLVTESMKNGKGVLIVDAGGGTIDISAYKRTSPKSESYEEIAPPQCAFNGSIFVTKGASEFLHNLLKGSKFEPDVPQLVDKFDKTAKLRFANKDEPQFIRFGRLNDNSPSLNIRAGQLKLLGSDIAKFFEPSISAISNIIEDQRKISKTEISSIFLVGGFAASKYLFMTLKSLFASYGLDVCRPDQHTSKAVADGAISYHIDHLVRSRVAKHSFGIGVNIAYDSSNPEHITRPKSIYTDLHGGKRIKDHFDVVLRKNTSVCETQEFRRNYYVESSAAWTLNTHRQAITCFRGLRTDPKWMDVEPKLYSILCHVEADLSRVPKPVKYSSHIGGSVYQVDFDIILSLGLTEFKAFIAWKELDGEEKRSVAQLVYDPDSTIEDSEIPII